MAKRKTIPSGIKRANVNSHVRQVENQLKEVNRRLNILKKGVDVNKGTYNPKTKRFERKGTYKLINERGDTITVKPSKIVSYGKDSWAGKKLKERLSTIKGIDLNNLKIPKNISASDLRALTKAVNNFLDSKTSTIQGIREVENRTKEGIKGLVYDIDSITNRDVETLYTFFEDKDFNYITKYIPPSDLFVILSETKSEGGDVNNFLRKIDNYLSFSVYQDEDLVDALEVVYNKFIR